MERFPFNEDYNLLKELFFLLDDDDRRFLKQFGLSPVQFYALLWLDGSEGKTLGQLSRDLLCDPGNVTRLTDRMEQKGLIMRQRGEQDRRITYVLLTPDGQALRDTMRQAHAEHVRQTMSILSETEQSKLAELLQKLHNGLASRLHEAPELF